MKRFWKLLTIIAAAAILQGCEGPAGPEGPMGPAGPAGTAFFYINKEYTIESQHWIKHDGYFSYTFNVPELTIDVCKSASVMVYRYYEDSQTPLPDVKHQSELVEDKDDNGVINSETIYWTVTVDYDYIPQQLTIYYTCSDFFDSEQPPTMDFRLVCHY